MLFRSAALLELVREPLTGVPIISADPSEVVTRLRQLALGVAKPLGLVAAGASAAAVLAHQAHDHAVVEHLDLELAFGHRKRVRAAFGGARYGPYLGTTGRAWYYPETLVYPETRWRNLNRGRWRGLQSRPDVRGPVRLPGRGSNSITGLYSCHRSGLRRCCRYSDDSLVSMDAVTVRYAE